MQQQEQQGQLLQLLQQQLEETRRDRLSAHQRAREAEAARHSSQLQQRLLQEKLQVMEKQNAQLNEKLRDLSLAALVG